MTYPISQFCSKSTETRFDICTGITDGLLFSGFLATAIALTVINLGPAACYVSYGAYALAGVMTVLYIALSIKKCCDCCDEDDEENVAEPSLTSTSYAESTITTPEGLALQAIYVDQGGKGKVVQPTYNPQQTYQQTYYQPLAYPYQPLATFPTAFIPAPTNGYEFVQPGYMTQH